MAINIKKLSPEERQKLKEEIDQIEKEEKEAYKHEFVESVVQTAIEKGVKWSEGLALLNAYTPKTDSEAKKLGYKFKGKDKNNKIAYYMRNMKGAKDI